MIQKKRIFSFLTIFSFSLLLCLLITTAYVHNKTKMELAQMEQLVIINANKVNSVITKLLYKTQVLSALVIQNNGEVRDFEQVAATIIDDPSIKNVLLAPNGKVSDVYPLEGNEAVLGFDYFSDSAGNHEAISAKETGQLVLGGPFNLVQGGQALVGRLPVFLKDNSGKDYFWGLVSVTLNYPEALNGAELNRLENQGYAYELWRISPDTNERQMISNSSYTYNKNARFIEHTITIQNATWYFRLSPIRSWYQHPETWIFSLSGLVISLLIASLVLHNQDLKQVKSELESLTHTDSLTGLINRRGLFHELNNLIQSTNHPFIMCYLDINNFKTVNDTLGHLAGDHLLLQFAEVFQKCLDKNCLFSRIGGDEFVLIIKNTGNLSEALNLLEAIQQEIDRTIILSNEQRISFCAGIAAFPQDADNVDELISTADKAMYEKKGKKQHFKGSDY